MMLDMFETMTAERAWDEHHWGSLVKRDSVVYRSQVGETTIWVGELDEDGERYVCEVEAGPDLDGQWDGSTPYEALLNGLIDSVIGVAVEEMWDEPQRLGLKYCCEDVILATATYGAQTLVYGRERLPELFPHSPEGVLTSPDEIELYHDLVDAAVEYIRFDIERLGGRLGIEFDEE